MPQIAGLIQRKALLLALLVLIIGVGLIGWTMIDLFVTQQASLTPTETAISTDLLESEGFAADPTAAPTLIPLAPTATTQPVLIVYVTGAVGAPDVYRLPADARIKDLVLAAGGFTADADPVATNLAAHLNDGEHVHILRYGEPAPNIPAALDQTAESAGSTTNPTGVVNINTASAADLDTLPGVGPALAARIIEYRSANGPFATIDDLGNVKGIGATLLEKLKPQITIGP